MKTIRRKEIPSNVERERIRELYRNNVYNIYMTSHIWEGVSYQQQDYIMRKIWSEGKIALFPLKHMEEEEYPFAITTFTEQSYNLYDFPASIKLINTRNVKFIPSEEMKVDEDVVIGYGQPSKKSIKSFVDVYIDKIVNVEMVLQIALNSQKMPFLIAHDQENKNEMDSLWNALMSDNPKLFVGSNFTQKGITCLVTNAPYIVDKLYNYKSTLWNELLTFLGINNLGVNEKKEHLVTSEVEANDDYVEASGDCITDMLKAFCERCKNVFGYSISVKSKSEMNNEIEVGEYSEEGEDEDVDKE